MLKLPLDLHIEGQATADNVGVPFDLSGTSGRRPNN